MVAINMYSENLTFVHFEFPGLCDFNWLAITWKRGFVPNNRHSSQHVASQRSPWNPSLMPGTDTTTYQCVSLTDTSPLSSPRLGTGATQGQLETFCHQETGTTPLFQPSSAKNVVSITQSTTTPIWSNTGGEPSTCSLTFAKLSLC